MQLLWLWHKAEGKSVESHVSTINAYISASAPVVQQPQYGMPTGYYENQHTYPSSSFLKSPPLAPASDKVSSREPNMTLPDVTYTSNSVHTL